ncbi:MAG: NAD(P)/FAD-dependent oxidoreductase [Clostridiales bacterium]|nr:NAD(P)/FAD-dependent oxidoreductase [Clostridiales bacterium]
MYDVIIIGTGPAGLMSGVQLNKKLKVLILEKNEKIGKKLLISGSGQCNLTHTGSIFDFYTKFNQEGRYIKRALSLFTNDDLMMFFKKRNLDLTVREDGKVFPKSLKSRDVLEVFENELHKMNREIKAKSKVVKIEYDEIFSVYTEKEKFQAKYVIIATGGMTYPSLGSSGDGYRFGKELGHRITFLKGGLSSITVKDDNLKEVSGIVLKEIEMALYREGKKINAFKGDLLFTHKGLSGPVIIDNSRYFEKGDEIKLNFDIQIENLNESKLIKNSLKESLSEKLVAYLVERLPFNTEKPLKQWNKKEKRKLIELLEGLNFIIDDVGNVNESMVTCGGVGFKDVNSKTFESRILKGLYFAGEVLNIDGESGGYNIQAAFSMGHLVANEINDSYWK